MKNTLFVPLFFSTLLLIGGGCAQPQKPIQPVQIEADQPIQAEVVPVAQPEITTPQSEPAVMPPENKATTPTEAPTLVTPTEAQVPVKKPAYEVYSPEKLTFATTGDVILFFHAPWCPTCKEADTNIKNSVDSSTANTLILKVDYDSATDLKKKYGVTYQHTFVQVDSAGTLIKKWSGSRTLEEILKNVE